MNTPRLPMKPARVIVVVGMHRSGTSAMTRALGYLGVGLGDTFIDVMPQVNAKGFWEDADFNRINIAVMRHLGCDWLSNRPIAPERFTSPGLQPLAEAAGELLDERLRTNRNFAFKDPRTTLLLPFWQAVFAQAGVQDDYLVAIRHPTAVAASLARRNGFDAAKSLNLWLRHTVEALQKSAQARRRVLVDYDVMMEDPVGTLRRIARWLDLPAPLAVAETEFSGNFLSADLRHCRPAEDAECTPAQTLYAALLPVARDEALFEDATVRVALERAAAHLDDCRSLLAYLDSVEHAAALGEQATPALFPWLNTLRSSFGVAIADPAMPPVSGPMPSFLRAIADRLRGRQA